MNPEDCSEATVDHQKAKNLIRSQYYNVMVKVDTDVYCLDKLQLAWKSDYFERLLTEYSDQGECNLIELPLMDSVTFSAIVDVMYGQALTSVLNNENYVSLLIAMDYLQMEIDLKTYASFIEKNLVLDMKIFKLYDFVRENPNLQCLMPSVSKYLSDHLASLKSYEEFLSLPLDDIILIIISSGISLPKEKEMRELCQTCAAWIHYDLESRLPYATKLVNAVRIRFIRLNDVLKDVDLNAKLTNVAEHMKLERIAKLFYELLIFDCEINPDGQEVPKFEDKKENTSINLEKNERKKLEKLLENNYFYDIVVEVEEKIYKLHRFKLNSASGYFADIFSAENFNTNTQCIEATTQQPYLLRDIDQRTFEMIIEYIYFEEVQLTCETITRVLKATAANNLKLEKLFDKCVSWMNENIEEVCSKVLIIDECISRSWIKENIEEICSEVLIKPEIINTFPICSISFDMLHNLLLSSRVCCDNPQKIVEVCSKWVMHDVKNRYHLIPQIAVAINRNHTIEYDNYKVEAHVDLNNVSEQLIRDELWNTLRSTSLVALVTNNTRMSKKRRKDSDFSKIPVFVTWTGDRTVHILNADLNEIASFSFSPNMSNTYFQVSATLIRDNLFVILTPLYHLRGFYVFNLTSRKLFSLNCSLERNHHLSKYSLLNCRDEVYCCHYKDGRVFKYLTELNRWMLFSKEVASRNIYRIHDYVWFTSTENALYRMYSPSFDTQIYVIEEFNFQQNVWLPLPDSTFTPARSPYDYPIDLISINAGSILAVIFPSYVMLFELNTRSWRQISLTANIFTSNQETPFALVQCQGELLHVFCNKLYRWSATDRNWVLKKELPSGSDLPVGVLEKPYPYKYITAVQRLGDLEHIVTL